MTKHVRLFDLGVAGDPVGRSEYLTGLIEAWAQAEFGIPPDRLMSQYNVAAMCFDTMGRLWVAVEFFVEVGQVKA